MRVKGFDIFIMVAFFVMLLDRLVIVFEKAELSK